MCGIAGFYKKNIETESPFSQEQVASVQAARGPDDNGYAVLSSGKVSLFHQRLSVIDLTSFGHQPMTPACEVCGKGIWLVYNGEIYNHKEIRNDLIKKGHNFFSQSDTEVIIHAYVEYGLEAFSKFNGIFSLALFDGRKKGHVHSIRPDDLIVVRDPLGVKPLFYSNHHGVFSFSSDFKTLLLDKKISRKIDKQALNDYLTYLWCPSPRTMLESIQKLEPGSLLIVRNGVICSQKKYYDIPVATSKSCPYSSEANLIEEARFMIEESVKRQMISDVPIGAFLSGGVDSSSIVALMKKIEPDKEIDCYTIKHVEEKKEGFVADYPYAKKVAKTLGVKLNAVDINIDIYNDIPDMIYHLEEPQSTVSPINTWLIAQRAKQDGYKVLMSGAGGDDIFSGYSRHYAIQIERAWQWLPKSVLSCLERVATNIPSGVHPYMRRLSKLLSHCANDDATRLASYYDWFRDEYRERLLVSSKKGPYSISKTIQEVERKGKISSLDKMLYLDCKHFLADHCFAYTDKMTMNCSIETRVPLVDLELVRFAFSLPDKYKQRGSTGKYIFKKAMEGILPNEILYRKKTGFGVPTRSWLEPGMGKQLNYFLSRERMESRGIFDFDYFKNIRTLNSEGKIDAAFIIQAVLFIEIWCKLFIDGDSLSSVKSEYVMGKR